MDITKFENADTDADTESTDAFEIKNTGQGINELENGPSSYRQKGIYFEWVFMKL